MKDNSRQFEEALDNHHQWPCSYTYKFIVPTDNLSQLTDLFPEYDISTRESKTGKYTSVTMTSTMCSAKEVMKVYEQAAQVSGVMSL